MRDRTLFSWHSGKKSSGTEPMRQINRNSRVCRGFFRSITCFPGGLCFRWNAVNWSQSSNFRGLSNPRMWNLEWQRLIEVFLCGSFKWNVIWCKFLVWLIAIGWVSCYSACFFLNSDAIMACCQIRQSFKVQLFSGIARVARSGMMSS